MSDAFGVAGRSTRRPAAFDYASPASDVPDGVVRLRCPVCGDMAGRRPRYDGESFSHRETREADGVTILVGCLRSGDGSTRRRVRVGRSR